MILHKFSQSPFQSNSIQSNLALIADDDAVLLIENAVYAIKHAAMLELLINRGSQLFILKEDCDARGLTNISDNIQQMDYAGFVELTLQYEKVVSW